MKHRPHHPILWSLPPLGLAVVFALLLVLGNGADGDAERMVPAVRDYIQRHYVEETDPVELNRAAVRGMLRQLDEHSTYLTPEQAEEWRIGTEGELHGIGIELTFEDGMPTVLTPIPDTPAFEAGLAAGDRILEIDGRSTADLTTFADVTPLLRGEAGTSVLLKLLDPDTDETRTVRVVRETIQLPSVQAAQMLPADPAVSGRTGYLRLTGFQAGSTDEVRAAVDDLRTRGMTSLVIDLRANGGGYMTTAIELADMFLEEGVIVRTRTRSGAGDETYEAGTEDDTITDLDLVLLVDGGSASASEILAAALRDNKRAVLVGERTYGKASIQTVEDDPRVVEEGGLLKLTIGRYHTPSGRPIQRTADRPWGLLPDITVEMTDDEVREMWEERRTRDVVHRNDDGEPESGMVFIDRQLRAAWELLRDHPRYLAELSAPVPRAAEAGSH